MSGWGGQAQQGREQGAMVVRALPHAFEVEFTTLDGRTTAVATMEALAVRPVTGHEITHSPELTRAS